jgi:hypothetical protein
MTDLRTAAQQALAHVQEFKRRWMAVPPFGNKVNKATREAVTLAHVPVLQLEEAIRTALEQPEQEQEPDRWGAGYEAGYAAGMAEMKPEQEPVAWMDPNSGEVCRAHWLESHAPERDVDRFSCPLYTHPPRREWRSLSEEEIRHFAWNGFLMAEGIWDKDTEEDLLTFARAIEAALRSKNHD